MSFLTGIEIKKLISNNKILINSLDPRYAFDPNQQVTEDAIDLRLSPFALKYKKGVTTIDYINDDLPSLFESIALPIDKGYPIRPRQVIFTQTLEAITFPEDLVGFVVTRSTFARLGLMINCGAPKFAIGISWAFPLQLVNCGSIPIVMYPYTVVAQLMVSTVEGPPVGYQGRYQNCFSPLPPVILERERKFLQDISADSAKRTFHILLKEIEVQKELIEKEAEKVQLEPKVTKKNDGNTQDVLKYEGKRSKRNTITFIVKTFMAILGSLSFGIVGNLLSGEEQSYWKTVSMILLIILGLVLIFGPLIFLQTSKDNDNDLPPID